MNVAIENNAVILDIEDELSKARAKFPRTDNTFVALVEEVGELAQALLKRQHECGKSHEDVYMEAIQVAAMAIRVAAEGDASFPNYDPESGFWGKGWHGYKQDVIAKASNNE